MDASQYKDYVLVILFVKYISDKKRNDEGFDIDIPKGCYFEDFVALKGNPNIGEEMNKKMAALAEENQLGGVFVADFEDDTKLGKGKDKVETLSKLIAVFQNENLDFSKNRAADDDLIGDAYEYLMKNFATESGKSKGQFYTPAEVSRVMAEVIGLGNAKMGKRRLSMTLLAARVPCFFVLCVKLPVGQLSMVRKKTMLLSVWQK